MPCSRELFSDVYLLLIVWNKSKFQSADNSTCVVYTVYTKTIIYLIVSESGGCLPSCEALIWKGTPYIALYFKAIY